MWVPSADTNSLSLLPFLLRYFLFQLLTFHFPYSCYTIKQYRSCLFFFFFPPTMAENQSFTERKVFSRQGAGLSRGFLQRHNLSWSRFFSFLFLFRHYEEGNILSYAMETNKYSEEQRSLSVLYGLEAIENSAQEAFTFSVPSRNYLYIYICSCFWCEHPSLLK